MTIICSGCGHEKAVSEFYCGGKNKKCKPCMKIYNAARYAAKREQIRAQINLYVAANREAVAARKAAYAKRRADYLKTFRQAWVIANADKLRDSRLKKYGLTLASYDAMLQKQGGRCKICGENPKANQVLSVDHCHATGKVRALLCSNCNTGIGIFYDDPTRLIAAAAYLKEHAA